MFIVFFNVFYMIKWNGPRLYNGVFFHVTGLRKERARSIDLGWISGT
jgi:hypothetical protein